MDEQSKIKVYGAPWCPDCRRAKQFFGEQHVAYDRIDVDKDPAGLRYVQKVNNGKQIIPTIVFEDGSTFTEPTNAELARKLGISPRAKRHYYDLVVPGADPAESTAFLYAALEGIETLVVERSGIGVQAGVTERIENYPGFPEGIEGVNLANRMRDQAGRFGVEILAAEAVTSIAPLMGRNNVRTETDDEYCASAVLLAPGTR